MSKLDVSNEWWLHFLLIQFHINFGIIFFSVVNFILYLAIHKYWLSFHSEILQITYFYLANRMGD